MANVGANRYLYSHITSAATTNIHQTGPVLLHSITVNDGATGTATVIDGTAATDASRATVAIVDVGDMNQRHYDVELSNGLVVVTDASCDITISYAKI